MRPTDSSLTEAPNCASWSPPRSGDANDAVSMKPPRTFVVNQLDPDDCEVRVLVVPHAGAGASVAAPLRTSAGPRWMIGAVRQAGRESRVREPVAALPAQVSTVVEAALALPSHPTLVVVGCCSGAAVAFEAVRALDRTHPGVVVVSRAGPRTVPPGLDDGNGDPAQRLVELSGFPESILAVPDALEILMPAVLGDFRAVDGYRAHATDRVSVPILIVAGDDDPHCRTEAMDGWGRHCVAVTHSRIWRALPTHREPVRSGGRDGRSPRDA